jgi:glycosyltransferase involved in cell wall biosynthesis
LRILHIIATLDPQAGGPSNSVRRIVCSYPAIGSSGEVVTLDHSSAPHLRGLGFKVHALGPGYTRYAFHTRLICWLSHNRDRFDGAVVHGLWQFTGLAAHVTLRGRVPYLVFTHGMLDPYFKQGHRLKHAKKYAYWLLHEYWMVRGAHCVLFTSRGEATNARLSFSPHLWRERVVPYGALAPTSEPATLVSSFLGLYTGPKDSAGAALPYILFLGRIHVKKGCDNLIEAFALIADRVPDLQLIVAGPDGEESTRSGNNLRIGTDHGNLKAALIARATSLGISHRVHWTGMLEGDQKWGALYGCEALCLPSHQENFGIVVAEALACGKPVLISNKVDIWRDVLDDGAAFVGSDDVDGTFTILRKWIALSSTQKKAMGERAHECFLRRYNMQENASGIVEILTEAIAVRSGNRTVCEEAKLPAA